MLLRGQVVYEEKTDARLIPMDARQQRMWELSFPRKSPSNALGSA